MRLSWLDYLRLARSVPLRVLPAKAWGVLWRGARGRMLQWQDRLPCTHPDDADLPEGDLPLWLGRLDRDALFAWREPLELAADMALMHKFDLLGSGPVRVQHGMAVLGVEGHRYEPASCQHGVNRANRAAARRLRALCDSAYLPIDWHLDFKSGYRWAEGLCYQQIEYGTLPGVDVKVPWELARCQHLPPLAMAILWAEPDRRARLAREFCHQVLDFAANNPPRFGVNWCCTMDVAIRAANWVLAYQLLRATPVAIDPVFEREFKRTLLAHGRHIVDNLEWSPYLRSNHYLSNLCGLLFIAAQLPEAAETDAWLAIAVPELVHECLSQFHEDGSNFEGSTSYHRLSAEMVAYALALLKALPVERLARVLREGPEALKYRGPGPDPRTIGRSLDGVAAIPWSVLAERMARAQAFTCAVIRPDGGVLQIGDNDSGRFFRLTPRWQLAEDGECRLAPDDHAHLVQALDALLQGGVRHAHPDAQMVAAIAGGGGLLGGTLLSPVLAPEWVCFPDFGVYIYRGDRLWCALRCGSVGQLGNGGHAHNDQLSMELVADGVAFLVDPGTYLYTPLPNRRNQLRATAAHNTIVSDVEQNGWRLGRLGLFSMSQVARVEVLAAEATEWIGRHHGMDGCTSTRAVRWTATGLRVVDEHDKPFALHFQLMPGSKVVQEQEGHMRLERMGRAIRMVFDQGRCVVGKGMYSAAYGMTEPAPRLHVLDLSGRVAWEIRLCEPE